MTRSWHLLILLNHLFSNSFFKPRLTQTLKEKSMLIGILNCGYPPENVKDNHGNYDAMFSSFLEGHGFKYQTWNVVDGDFPALLLMRKAG